jgi:hypothetical protein
MNYYIRSFLNLLKTKLKYNTIVITSDLEPDDLLAIQLFFKLIQTKLIASEIIIVITELDPLYKKIILFEHILPKLYDQCPIHTTLKVLLGEKAQTDKYIDIYNDIILTQSNVEHKYKKYSSWLTTHYYDWIKQNKRSQNVLHISLAPERTWCDMYERYNTNFIIYLHDSYTIYMYGSYNIKCLPQKSNEFITNLIYGTNCHILERQYLVPTTELGSIYKKILPYLFSGYDDYNIILNEITQKWNRYKVKEIKDNPNYKDNVKHLQIIESNILANYNQIILADPLVIIYLYFPFLFNISYIDEIKIIQPRCISLSKKIYNVFYMLMIFIIQTYCN